MNSALYRLKTKHSRLLPRKHSFEYSFFMFAIDLDELDELAARFKFIGFNRAALFSFYNEDHLEAGSASIKAKLMAVVSERAEAISKIIMLTNLRMCGYVFNPITVYYLFDAESKPLSAVVEVENTFRERKAYLLPTAVDDQGKVAFSASHDKNFYVSPFSQADDTFKFWASLPDESLTMIVTNVSAGNVSLVSSMTGVKVPLSDRSLACEALKHPLMTLHIIFMIHWQALLLFLKKVPHKAKADKSEYQTGMAYRPDAAAENFRKDREVVEREYVEEMI